MTPTPAKRIDYTEMAHHNEIPDAKQEYDISSPQGPFWDGNERPGADSIKDVHLEDEDPDTGRPRDPNLEGDRGGTS